jgi:hypothetical protein
MPSRFSEATFFGLLLLLQNSTAALQFSATSASRESSARIVLALAFKRQRNER